MSIARKITNRVDFHRPLWVDTGLLRPFRVSVRQPAMLARPAGVGSEQARPSFKANLLCCRSVGARDLGYTFYLLMTLPGSGMRTWNTTAKFYVDAQAERRPRWHNTSVRPYALQAKRAVRSRSAICQIMANSVIVSGIKIQKAPLLYFIHMTRWAEPSLPMRSSSVASCGEAPILPPYNIGR